MIPFPNKKYKIILCDPPWFYSDGRATKSRGCARASYSLMKIDDIKNLPVAEIADKDCLCFLWVTMPMLKEGLAVLEAWGFKYRTCAFTWVKQNPKSEGIYSGLGYWTNGNAELVLLGRKGNPKRVSKCVKQICLQHVGRHSQKPAEIRERIVKLMGDLPRIELFARKPATLVEDPSWEGWDVWGKEVEQIG
jgi:N6-adenosine-specific RNA methylase IME4